MNRYLLNIVSAILGVAVFTLLYVTFVPIDVLKDWSVQINGPVHRPGETVVSHVTYRKIRNVYGLSSRDLECTTSANSSSRYPIDTIIANRPPTIVSGTQTVDISLILPNNVGNLPATCHITTTIQYEIYKFRTFTEYNQSNNFMVKE